jgi:hypothetical protein
MNSRILVVACFLFLLGLSGIAAQPDQPQPEKKKDTIQSLFDGIPQDLRAKVQANPVRCDRVNDWLQENVNGKGLTIEVRVEMQEVLPFRKEMAYQAHLFLKETKVKLLDAAWELRLSDHNSVGGKTLSNFSFEGVNAVDAEKLADMERAVIKGKVKQVRISRMSFSAAPNVAIVLEDVLVEGNRWTPSATPYRKSGGFTGGADNPFGGALKGKKGGDGKGNPKKGMP